MTNDFRNLIFVLLVLVGLFVSLAFVPFPGSVEEGSEVQAEGMPYVDIVYPVEGEEVPNEFDIQGDVDTEWFNSHAISAVIYDEYGNFLFETSLRELENMDLGGRIGIGGVVDLGAYRGGATLSVYATTVDGSASETISSLTILVVDGALEESEEDF